LDIGTISYQGICDIITVCSECGVSSFKLNGLEILFGKQPIASESLICDNILNSQDDIDEDVDDFVEPIETLLQDPLEYERQQLKQLGEL
jgi:hypothetical protein